MMFGLGYCIDVVVATAATAADDDDDACGSMIV